uniref:WD40 repeat domain-containing protein n=1 Tax=Ningiella ruwaisensis TaxID=2364274 RepID=UPI0010A08D75|nr:PQQ-binding-like beta-propeller repeat protein [Ningiella ruwaisensis]
MEGSRRNFMKGLGMSNGPLALTSSQSLAQEHERDVADSKEKSIYALQTGNKMKKFTLTASTILTALALGASAFPSFAGGKLALNHVWSRMADLNGELGSVESAEFSADSRFITTGTKFDYSVRVFSTIDGTQVWERTLPQEIERVAWTKDGKHVASVSEDGMLKVFNSQTGEDVFSFKHTNGIDGLSVSHDNRYLVSGRERVDGIGMVRVFSTKDWSIEKEIEFPGTVNELDFSSDDKYLAAVGDFSVKIFNVSDFSVHQEFSIDEDRYFEDEKHIFINTRFSPDNKTLAVGGTQGYVYFFDVESGEMIRRMNKSGQKTETVEWTKDGRFFLVAGHGNTIDFFDVDHIMNKEIKNDSIPYALRAEVTDALEYMDFNETGVLLTTAHQDGTVQLWTYMSDDPRINERRHREVRAYQDKSWAADKK